MRRWLGGLIGVFTILLLLELPGSWLFDPDETRYAEIPREMLATGDFVTPRLNGSVYFEKPPLLYWLNAGSMALFGETPFPARLPTRLATLGTAILLILSLSSSAAPAAGLWAALIFLSAPLSFVLGRINLTDGILTFSLTWAILALRTYLYRSEKHQRTWPIEMAFGTGTALAVLSKGLVGILFPAMVLIIWTAIHGQWKKISDLLFSWASIVFLAISVPWFVLVEKENPGFCYFFFIHEHFLRYATKEAARPGASYYFVVTFLLGFLPWTLLFLKTARPLITLRRKIWQAHPDESFFVVWFLSILVFFSVSQSKLIPYILPAFPAACALVGKALAAEPGLSVPWKIQAPIYLFIAIGVAVASTIESGFFVKYSLETHAILIAALLVVAAWTGVSLSPREVFHGHVAHVLSWSGVYLVLILAVPKLAEHYADQGLAEKARETPSDSKVCYETFSNSFPWVQKAYIPAAKYEGEFPSVGDRSPRLFWNQEEFFKRWNSSERLVVIVRKKSLEHFASLSCKPVILVANRRSVLVANFDVTQERVQVAAARKAAPAVFAQADRDIKPVRPPHYKSIASNFHEKIEPELNQSPNKDGAKTTPLSSTTTTVMAAARFSKAPLSVKNFYLDDEPKSLSLSRGAKNTLGVIGALALVASQDQALQEKIPRFFSHTFGEWSPESFGERGNIERLGRLPGAAQVAGGFYMTGVVTGSVRARRVGVLALEAKLVNDFFTRGFKHAIGRERPGSPASDGDEFKPFGSADSFPSGHTSSAFALATVVADNYESKWIKFTSYGLATAVGLGRINQGAHWASDVAGGALVGYGVGKLISGWERRKGWSRTLYFEGNGVSVKKEFQ